ncbi:hypothetical protein IAR55_003100 [Kwoniella newhampshirensis]|uniref:Transmembrane protein n=1 Tax=Kwoniella newhampshirensis TaxID=1651941 RepID=A0AAW0YZR6_9TREE
MSSPSPPDQPTAGPSSSPSFPSQPQSQSSPRPQVSQSSHARSKARRDLHPERSYTGPDPATLDAPRSRTQAEKYFARVANENILPSRMSKMLGVGGWVLGGFACVYMTLYADFGNKEHVFSPVRRQYANLRNSFFTLSPKEREMMGVDERQSSVAAETGFVGEEQTPGRETLTPGAGVRFREQWSEAGYTPHDTISFRLAYAMEYSSIIWFA